MSRVSKVTSNETRKPRVLPVFLVAHLQHKLQARLGIVEQLQTAGGSMTRREIYNIRRDRKNTYRWVTAMLQLLGNGIVEETGTGRRGDPVTVRLVKPLLNVQVTGATDTGQAGQTNDAAA